MLCTQTLRCCSAVNKMLRKHKAVVAKVVNKPKKLNIVQVCWEKDALGNTCTHACGCRVN